MAEQSIVEVGNAMILLASADDPFSDGRTTGWMEALMENAPQTFKSFVFSERITALQTM